MIKRKKMTRIATTLFISGLLMGLSPSDLQSAEVERVSTVVPFPRGLAKVGDDLIVLSRGRVRGAGGVTAEIEDRAGTIFRLDPKVSQPVDESPVSDAVKNNGEPLALPTDPPFNLWDRSSTPPESDRLTDRPYCVLRYHEPTSSYYICAFSGIDKPKSGTGRTFSKNLTDAILRYDTRTEEWSEVERHAIQAGGNYPHHDPAHNDPPHGWLNGPDNAYTVGNWLYAVGKDNSLMVRYDLRPYIDNPEAGPAESEWMLGSEVHTRNAGKINMRGHSALAYHDGYLYIASRTSSHIVRMKMDEDGNPAVPYEIDYVARFMPYSPETGKSADITDIAFDDQGRLYVVNAKPSRVHRFTPDPDNIYDARNGQEGPWMNFADMTNNQNMKSENILIVDDTLYITSGDGYDFQYGAAGTVYRTKIND
jgi:hypothetical protein